MRIRSGFLTLAALGLCLLIALPASAPAAGGGDQGGIAKKCKKGYHKVHGKCKKKKKKKSSGGSNTYTGTPSEITVTYKSPTATFKWQPKGCPSGVPSSITETATLANNRFTIDKQLGTFKLRVVAYFTAPKLFHGQATIFDSTGHIACGKSFTLKN